MEPMEPRKGEATRPDEGTSSDETVRSNEGARSDERTRSDEWTCSDESAAHADAGSMETTATAKPAAETAHASIRGRRRRHCTNEDNGRSGNHDLTPHTYSPVPFLGTLLQSCLRIKRALGSRCSAAYKLFLSQFLTRESVLAPQINRTMAARLFALHRRRC
jgi:hypothetical protein